MDENSVGMICLVLGFQVNLLAFLFSTGMEYLSSSLVRVLVILEMKAWSILKFLSDLGFLVGVFCSSTGVRVVGGEGCDGTLLGDSNFRAPNKVQSQSSVAAMMELMW